MSPITKTPQPVVEDKANKLAPKNLFDEVPVGGKNKGGAVPINFDEVLKPVKNAYGNNAQNENRALLFPTKKTQEDEGRNTAISFDDFPVKNNKPQNFDDIPIKSNRAKSSNDIKKAPISFDDMPIKGNAGGNKMVMTFEDDPKPAPVQKQKKAPPKVEREPEQDEEEYESQESGYTQQYHNPFDDVPIKGVQNKDFNDILAENLRKNSSTPKQESKSSSHPLKKPFLKKGSRAHLSSAVDRPATSYTEKNKENDVEPTEDYDFFSKTPTHKPASKSVIPPNFSAKNLNTKFNSSSKLEKAEISEADSNKPKETKKFLSRGKGMGGGKAGALATEKSKSNLNENNSAQNAQNKSKSPFENRKKSVVDDEEDFLSAKAKFGAKNVGRKYSHNDYEDNEEEEKEENEDQQDEEDQDNEYNFEKYANSSNQKKFSNDSKPQEDAYKFDDEEAFNDHDPKNDREGSPPHSSLIDKYFYGNKNKQKKQVVEKAKKAEASEKDDRIKALVNEKIEQLNSEIAKFKLENERSRKLKSKFEDL